MKMKVMKSKLSTGRTHRGAARSRGTDDPHCECLGLRAVAEDPTYMEGGGESCFYFAVQLSAFAYSLLPWALSANLFPSNGKNSRPRILPRASPKLKASASCPTVSWRNT